MKINALRKELNDITGNLRVSRKPALRRSMNEEWLYVTDLPATVDSKELKAFISLLRDRGWETETEGLWIRIRKEIHEPPPDWYEGPYGTERACCRSLLKRHPDRETEPDCRIEYRLICAGEEGPDALETVCTQLHRDWAERLKEKQKLPDISIAFFE